MAVNLDTRIAKTVSGNIHICIYNVYVYVCV